MYTLGAGRLLIKSIIIVCLLNLMAWKASWAHRTNENKKKDNDKIKKVGPNVERLCENECSLSLSLSLIDKKKEKNKKYLN